MRTLESTSEDAIGLQHSGIVAAEVRKELEDILQSPPFRTSRQCRDLLRYIVEHSLAGQESDLRERIVGIEVFHRLPDYDTAEDPVVRMRAADVRKRLAQFYQAEQPRPLHIELKPGAYRANFRVAAILPAELTAASSMEVLPVPVPVPAAMEPEKAALTQSTPISLDAAPIRLRAPVRIRRLWPFLAAFAVLLLCVLGVVGVRAWTTRTSAQARFWAPVTRRQEPVLIYVGANVAYRFTPSYLNHYRQQHGLAQQNGPEFFPELPPGATIRSEDLLPVKDTFITTGDLAASMQVVSLMKGWSRPFVLRSADDLSMSDLRNAPTVLIGGFNNRWSLATTDQLPLAFRDGISIVDRANPSQHWTISQDDRGDTTQDFALISRITHSSTGGPALVVGGIGSYGTQAAAEFVCSPEKMNELLRSAPAGWEGKNMQAVLRIHVVGYTPVNIEVAKIYFW